MGGRGMPAILKRERKYRFDGWGEIERLRYKFDS
jgi:hypothetical protein